MFRHPCPEVFEQLVAPHILREALLELAADKFGPPTPEQVAKVNATDDVPKLKRLLKRIRTAADWDALLRVR